MIKVINIKIEDYRTGKDTYHLLYGLLSPTFEHFELNVTAKDGDFTNK